MLGNDYFNVTNIFYLYNTEILRFYSVNINADDIILGLKSISNTTALGIDQWAPAQLKALPREALEELAAVLNAIEQHVAWPARVLYNLIVLMGKPGVGTRPIALMPVIYRIWTKVRKPYLMEWE